MCPNPSKLFFPFRNWKLLFLILQEYCDKKEQKRDITENTVILSSRHIGLISDQMETVREGLKTVRNGEQFIGDESVASLEAEFRGCEQLFTEWKQIGKTDKFRLTISDEPIHSVERIGLFGQVLKKN